jgi:hypothetical protein
MGRRLPDSTLTLRIDPDVVLWARMRALRSGTSVNQMVRQFLEEYAAVPLGFWEGLSPPWDSDEPPPSAASSQ